VKKKPELAPDWPWLVRHAWSMRFMMLAGVFGTVEIMLPLFMDDMPRHVFAVLSIVAIVGGMASRVMVQKR